MLIAAVANYILSVFSASVSVVHLFNLIYFQIRPFRIVSVSAYSKRARGPRWVFPKATHFVKTRYYWAGNGIFIAKYFKPFFCQLALANWLVALCAGTHRSPPAQRVVPGTLPQSTGIRPVLSGRVESRTRSKIIFLKTLQLYYQIIIGHSNRFSARSSDDNNKTDNFF